jgi:TPR repeat protein
LRLRPDDARVLGELALACVALRRLSEAEAALRERVHLAPRCAEAHAALGDFLSRERSAIREAERCFRAAARLDSEDPVRLVAEGSHALRRGEARSGRALLLRAARRGFAPAERELGRELCRSRRASERARGLRWLERAAGRGDPEASHLAAVARDGDGAGPSSRESLIHTVRAAAGGFAPAQVRLGRLCARARGLPRDLERAVRCYRAAAERGDADGAFALGEAYDHGLGLEPDPQQALRWYARAARRGHTEAQLAQALLLDSGELGWRDVPRHGVGCCAPPARARRVPSSSSARSAPRIPTRVATPPPLRAGTAAPPSGIIRWRSTTWPC